MSDAPATEPFGLHFGTAGLRAPMGPGPDRMNRDTVKRASAGLAAWVKRQAGGRRPSIVVGYDARHHSAQFAADAAAVFAGAGIRGLLMPVHSPTPVLAYAVRELRADAGVMVTASHNPAADNGYKVYAADGAQIVPPADAEISAAIAATPAADELALGEPESAGGDVIDRYLAAVVPLALARVSTAREVSIVYTPVHGVGEAVMRRALALAGFPAAHAVAEQAQPDPDFPTAPRPNPEEPGVLDLALRDARRLEADIVIANDPDADRLAVAVPWPGADGGWRVLSGDEVGAILADRLLAGSEDPSGALLVTTVVSGSLLGAQARAAGARYAQTLTGFKWIMHLAESHPETPLLLGYEQALGYGVTELVRDKDGISAGLAMAAIAAAARAEGTTLKDRLDAIAERFGLHATAQRSIDLTGEDAAEQADAVWRRLAASPPRTLGRHPVTAVDDLSTGQRRRGGETTPLGLPTSSGVVIHAGDAARLAVRPSGTEPKLKLYLQVVVPTPPGQADAARDRAASLLDELGREAQELTLR